MRGYLSAYSAETGSLVWRFYTVPNPNKQPDGAISDNALKNIGNLTWGDEGAWTTDGGGGTVWDSIVYDEVNDSVIFGVGMVHLGIEIIEMLGKVIIYFCHLLLL